MATKHWKPANFKPTRDHSYSGTGGPVDTRSGYCDICGADMLWFKSDGLHHYSSHSVARQLGIAWKR
jgi:hypothetical protein